MHMIVILDNLRSIENVGSVYRTADALGVEKLFLCGTTPRPHPNEPWRRDHLALKKTALGAEITVPWEFHSDTLSAIKYARRDGYRVFALETGEQSQNLTQMNYTNEKIALIVGNEVEGIQSSALELADTVVHIPMLGSKESLNVAVSFGIAAFWLRYHR